MSKLVLPKVPKWEAFGNRWGLVCSAVLVFFAGWAWQQQNWSAVAFDAVGAVLLAGISVVRIRNERQILQGLTVNACFEQVIKWQNEAVEQYHDFMEWQREIEGP